MEKSSAASQFTHFEDDDLEEFKAWGKPIILLIRKISLYNWKSHMLNENRLDREEHGEGEAGADRPEPVGPRVGHQEGGGYRRRHQLCQGFLGTQECKHD